MAYLLFARKQFGKALTALLQFEFTDVFYALDSRTLQIKIYFELEETDALMSALEAFKVYLRRNRTISDSVRTIYMNFVRFVNRILSVPPSDSEKKQKLHEKILEAGNVADIRWLLQRQHKKAVWNRLLFSCQVLRTGNQVTVSVQRVVGPGVVRVCGSAGSIPAGWLDLIIAPLCSRRAIGVFLKFEPLFFCDRLVEHARIQYTTQYAFRRLNLYIWCNMVPPVNTAIACINCQITTGIPKLKHFSSA